MSINWPDIFPSPTLQSYGFSPDESIARTNMDSGFARQRQRFTSVPSRVKIRWLMSQEILGLFESFYRFKAKEGAEWILMNLTNGLGFTQNEVRFLAPYDARVLSNNLWEVMAELEVREFNVKSELELDLILDLGHTTEEVELAANAFHALINNELPGRYNWG